MDDVFGDGEAWKFAQASGATAVGPEEIQAGLHNWHTWRYQECAESDIGIPYESGIPGILELLLTRLAIKHGPAWLKAWARKHLQTKALHCSEANVRRSQQGGYYDRTKRANKLPPYTFWTGGEYEKGFIKGSLAKPIQIK